MTVSAGHKVVRPEVILVTTGYPTRRNNIICVVSLVAREVPVFHQGISPSRGIYGKVYIRLNAAVDCGGRARIVSELVLISL